MTEQDMRKKVIEGLECCTVGLGTNQHRGDLCAVCPYKDKDLENWYCFHRIDLMRDSLALLKAQEPRVLALEELPDWDGAFLIETRVKGAMTWASWYSEYELYGETVCRMVDIGGEVDDRFKKLYGYEWRCWTCRPTDEQREAVKWE